MPTAGSIQATSASADHSTPILGMMMLTKQSLVLNSAGLYKLAAPELAVATPVLPMADDLASNGLKGAAATDADRLMLKKGKRIFLMNNAP